MTVNKDFEEEYIIFYFLERENFTQVAYKLLRQQFFFAFNNLDYNGFWQYLCMHGEEIEDERTKAYNKSQRE